MADDLGNEIVAAAEIIESEQNMCNELKLLPLKMTLKCPFAWAHKKVLS